MESLTQAVGSLKKVGALPFQTLADGHVGVTPKARQKIAAFLAKR